MGFYRLICQEESCQKTYEGNVGYRLVCDREAAGEHGPALLKAEYEQKHIELRPELPGVFQYADWMPTNDYYIAPQDPALSAPICYKSHGLARYLGLNNLYIAFSGYWPERGCHVISRSFKEFEVQASMVRYLSSDLNNAPMPLIVSSAGNTGNAYNLTAAQLEVPIYLVLPESGLDKLVLPFPTQPQLIAVDGDYYDAIDLANKLQAALGLGRDGGVKNVGRRAGMGVAMLNAVLNPESGHDGSLFEHYFQAVGSASGAIAAWEAVELLLQDGRFGKTRTRIHMVQNEPFTPIPDSWEAQSRDVVMPSESAAKENIAQVTAQVLTNRKPPYGLPGGIYDVLKNSEGMTWRANNYAIFQAARSFRETEKVDISEASAVALCGLEQAIAKGAVQADDKVLLHITGGGTPLEHAEIQEYRPEALARVAPGDVDAAIAALGAVQPIHNATAHLQKVSQAASV